MSKPEVLIQAVVVERLSYGQVAARYGVSKSLVHRLHHRWLVEGDAAFQPRSSRPLSSPNQTPPGVTTRILQLRSELIAAGLDAGADTILAHLDRDSQTPSRATIWRILSRAGLVVPQPQKCHRHVTDTFTAAARAHGFPASTLTDNGNVYTTKYAGGARGRGTANAFETLLALEGITQKNGRPYKPTTQGKIEVSGRPPRRHDRGAPNRSRRLP